MLKRIDDGLRRLPQVLEVEVGDILVRVCLSFKQVLYPGTNSAQRVDILCDVRGVPDLVEVEVQTRRKICFKIFFVYFTVQ